MSEKREEMKKGERGRGGGGREIDRERERERERRWTEKKRWRDQKSDDIKVETISNNLALNAGSGTHKCLNITRQAHRRGQSVTSGLRLLLRISS